MLGQVMLVGLSAFAMIDRPDPITQQRQLAIATEADSNVLMIGCAKPHTINIMLKPYRYRRARSTLLFQPHAAYRFENGPPYTAATGPSGPTPSSSASRSAEPT